MFRLNFWQQIDCPQLSHYLSQLFKFYFQVYIKMLLISTFILVKFLTLEQTYITKGIYTTLLTLFQKNMSPPK